MQTVLRKLLVLAVATVGYSNLQAQDTLRVMTWNLTNYANITTECPTTGAGANGVAQKDPNLNTVVNYVKPHLLSVNEMSATSGTARQRILVNVLNVNGTTAYAEATPFKATSNSSLGNAIFYDTRKLVLKKKTSIPSQVRLTDWCIFYYNSPALANGDTVFLNVLSTHLKAGNTQADVNTRTGMAQTISSALASAPKGNYLICGDFNLYTSAEGAWQALTNPTVPNHPARFEDPVNRVGQWSNNPAFADVHTQCPSQNYNAPCFSGGGLDDRFDFILMNRFMLADSAGARYLPGTYKAIGQDGIRYNGEVDNPTNTQVPGNVADALVRASDHLPVVAHVRVNPTWRTSVAPWLAAPSLHLSGARRAGHSLDFNIHADKALTGQVQLVDGAGRVISLGTVAVQPGLQPVSLPCGELAAGIYVLQYTTPGGERATARIALF